MTASGRFAKSAALFAAPLREKCVNMDLGVFMEVKRKGSLLSFRPDIKVLDATLRDGGLCNNFEFSDEFAKALYKMLSLIHI